MDEQAVDAEHIDRSLRTVAFEGHSPAEVFGRAASWLAQRDGSVGVIDVGWHLVADGEPFSMHVYYYPE